LIDRIIQWVVKVGGSLFPKHAINLIKTLKGTNSLIITGGGEFANLIRKYDDEIGFSSDVTHQTAIESMDIIAKLLNDKFDFTQLAYSLKDALTISENGFIPILLCLDILNQNKDIESSWEFTSDSISLYFSKLLKAKLLIATNVDGIYTRNPNDKLSKFIDIIDAKKLLTFKETSVDLMLAKLLIQFESDCFVVNGKFPERVLSLINDNINDYNFKYTYIRGY